MAKIIKIKNKQNIDLSAYVNFDTGEYMSSEVGEGVKVSIVKETTKSLVTYSDYVVLNREAMLYVRSLVNEIDLGRICLMSLTVRTPMSVLFNGNTPFNNGSLQEYLGISSRSKYVSFMNRVINIGFLFQIRGLINGRSRTIYVMNPHLSKKGKMFENVILDLFTKFDGN